MIFFKLEARAQSAGRAYLLRSSLVVGVLGGGAGTARDTFELIHQAEKYGARVALFGRKINLAEDPLAMVKHMRAVADGDIGPEDAVNAYYGACKHRADVVPLTRRPWY